MKNLTHEFKVPVIIEHMLGLNVSVELKHGTVVVIKHSQISEKEAFQSQTFIRHWTHRMNNNLFLL